MSTGGRHDQRLSRNGGVLGAKYPRTPYWPWSPSVATGDRVHPDPEYFVGQEVVVTEKLDGGNTLLHEGQVYARGASAPSEAKWMAMVKKHHAWKIRGQDIWVYGEDLYGVHSIEYHAVPENQTFYMFAVLMQGQFASFAAVEEFGAEWAIPVAPVLFRGRFGSVNGMRERIDEWHETPSVLGGEREGIVMRLADGFPRGEFARHTCKSVRAGHVQTDEHWSRNWRACRISGRQGADPW